MGIFFVGQSSPVRSRGVLLLWRVRLPEAAENVALTQAVIKLASPRLAPSPKEETFMYVRIVCALEFVRDGLKATGFTAITFNERKRLYQS